ncbi:hypothetical protein [Paraflavitalea sp. CAU 1676]|uniref:hypothetical protein n=1 Tax=Paraflavitalea sp. CAU 1676 TaxID=3032598 RepID=UPI0023DC9AA3|nr:hypothetical protein [Paraflavitalea sp. CAU 1676]MDF2192061.1 hypothetical protein [Paraflavitalea sp. CAU 1676]
MKYCCLFVSLLLTSCILKGKKSTTQEIAHYDWNDGISRYFPDGGKWTAKDSISLVVLPKFLSAIGEKPLPNYGINTPVVRFVYCESLRDPFVIRIDNKEIVVKEVDQTQKGLTFKDSIQLLSVSEQAEMVADREFGEYVLRVAREEDMTGIVPPPAPYEKIDHLSVLSNKQRVPVVDFVVYTLTTTQIDPSPVRDLLTRIDAAGFWQWNVYDSPYPGADGGSWYLEVMAHGKHHLVHYWSPGDGPFKTLCKSVLKYSHINGDKIH